MATPQKRAAMATGAGTMGLLSPKSGAAQVGLSIHVARQGHKWIGASGRRCNSRRKPATGANPCAKLVATGVNPIEARRANSAGRNRAANFGLARKPRFTPSTATEWRSPETTLDIGLASVRTAASPGRRAGGPNRLQRPSLARCKPFGRLCRKPRHGARQIEATLDMRSAPVCRPVTPPAGVARPFGVDPSKAGKLAQGRIHPSHALW